MILLILVVVILAAPLGWAQNNCLDCHLELEDDALTPPATAFANDVHAKAGLTCASCHGGDPAANVDDGEFERAMDPAKGYIGVPKRSDVPNLCGSCHSDPAYMHGYDPNIAVDQAAQYWTSVHGQKLRAGDEKVAECASCHQAHGILAVKDPRSPVYPTQIPETCGVCHGDARYMSDYGIPTNQLEEYRTSVHGQALIAQGDLGAPACNSCHGNHGAAPPGVDSVSRVCGTCHAIQQELFAASPHQEAFQSMELPECEACHENHATASPTDAMLGTAEGSICLDCHTEGEDAFVTAATIRQSIEDLKAAETRARELVERAGRAGMEVSDAEVALIDAHQSLVETRNMIHTVASGPVEDKVKEGLVFTKSAEEMGAAALKELDYRRIGLAVSLLFILAMVLGLYLKIRQIEGAERESPR
jgi:predicted CXXCH cytochrome family protein